MDSLGYSWNNIDERLEETHSYYGEGRTLGGIRKTKVDQDEWEAAVVEWISDTMFNPFSVSLGYFGSKDEAIQAVADEVGKRVHS